MNLISSFFNTPHPFFGYPTAPLSPPLYPGARSWSAASALLCGGWQALLWSLVDEWVSSGLGVRIGCL